MNRAATPSQPGLLTGLRIVECSSFVAGPSGCLNLGMLGAEIIKVDPIGGPPDFHRWPLSGHSGESLFWSSLNRGKKSVAVDMRSAEGRELIVALATRPGPQDGLLVDNIGRDWLGYATLAARRADVIQVSIQGHNDGRPAVDYTVNPEVGLPAITGPQAISEPVNHVLPAWDLLTGMTAATALLAAVRRRDLTGEGSFAQIALSDIAYAGVASMGWLAEAVERGDRPRQGNHLYGSFGIDFATRDGHRVMVVALTGRQWRALVDVTGTAKVLGALEEAAEVDLSAEGDRYRLRETITAVMRPWFAARDLAQLTDELNRGQVLWSRYRTMSEAAREVQQDPDTSVITQLDQPDLGTITSARSPIRLGGNWIEPTAAPRLGQDTDEVLQDLLGLTSTEVAGLHDRGVVAGAA